MTKQELIEAFERSQEIKAKCKEFIKGDEEYDTVKCGKDGISIWYWNYTDEKRYQSKLIPFDVFLGDKDIIEKFELKLQQEKKLQRLQEEAEEARANEKAERVTLRRLQEKYAKLENQVP